MGRNAGCGAEEDAEKQRFRNCSTQAEHLARAKFQWPGLVNCFSQGSELNQNCRHTELEAFRCVFPTKRKKKKTQTTQRHSIILYCCYNFRYLWGREYWHSVFLMKLIVLCIIIILIGRLNSGIASPPSWGILIICRKKGHGCFNRDMFRFHLNTMTTFRIIHFQSYSRIICKVTSNISYHFGRK